MASQWTIPKIVTWRVKDWASCFLATKFSIDVDEETNNNNLTFKKIKTKIKSSTKKKRSERKLSLSPPGATRHHHLRSSSVSPTTTSTSQQRRLSWPQPPVSEEAEFIVFCFDSKDGSFDVVKEGKQEKNEIDLLPAKSPRRMVNRKLIYGVQGVGETERHNSKEVNETEHVQNDNTSCQETEDDSSNAHEKNEEEEVNDSDKSSGSNNSDERRGSFAFPILGAEWMGSPVQMPKLDDFSPKKQKPVALGFQCCRF